MLKLCYWFFSAILFSPLFAAAPWIDLPPDDYTKILHCSTAEAVQLNERIKAYTEIPKSDLSNRIQSLIPIMALLDIWIQEESKLHLKERLRQLRLIANNKKWYLEQLMDCYTQRKFEDEYLNETLRTVPFLKEGRKALFMINERRYHTKYGEYWGEYWLEAMDPCHRQLMTYRDRWLKEHSSGQPPFFLWLEEQNLSKDVPYLDYLSEQGLCEAQVVSRNGLLYFDFSNQIVSQNQATEFLFVVDLEEKLILARGSKLIHHNSLSLSKPVLAIGKMSVFKGTVTALSFESGHYIPTVEDDVRMILLLEELGVILDPSIPLTFYTDEGREEIPIGVFLESNFTQTDRRN